MSWPLLELHECTSFVSGGTPNKGRSEYWGGEIPWVSSGEMTRQFLYDTSLRITEVGAEAGSRLMPAGTTFIVVRGMSLAREFRISFAKCPMAFNQDLKALIVKDGIDPYFLFCSLRAHADQIRDLATEAAHGTKKLEMERLKSFPISVPNLDVQKRAAECVRNYDELIENNRRRIALLEESARLLYREWFVKLRFPGHELVKVVDGLPEGWQKAPLGNLINTSSGGTPSRGRAEFYGDGIPWVKTKELNDGYILETEEQITSAGLSSSSAKLFPEKTVLLAMYGATIGRTAILGLPAATNQACCAFLIADTPGLSEYTFLWLRERKDVLVGLGMGAAQPNLSQEIIKKIEFLMPHANILYDFGKIVGELFDQVRVLTHQNSKLVEARDALLPKLMSGQLAV